MNLMSDVNKHKLLLDIELDIHCTASWKLMLCEPTGGRSKVSLSLFTGYAHDYIASRTFPCCF
jgi:hypothetical protein